MTEPKKKFQLNPHRPTAEQIEGIAKATTAGWAVYIPKVGSVTQDGIYLGQYSPKDRDGKSLSKTFNVFASPEDLPGVMRYVDAVKHIAGLKNWHGFDGTNYTTDKEIYAALKDGSYNGGWIIPTRDILHGKDVGGNLTTPDNILAHKNKGAFNGTFKMAATSCTGHPDWYWSSTGVRSGPAGGVWVVRLPDDNACWYSMDGGPLPCRPVRLVECKAV